MSDDKPVGEGYEVRCQNCGDTFHETTEEFTLDAPTNGRMLRLLPMFGLKGANWSSFPFDSAVIGDALECPGCGCPYTGGGTRVKVRPKKPTIIEKDAVVRENFVQTITIGGKRDVAEVFSGEVDDEVAAAVADIKPPVLDDEDDDGGEPSDGTSCEKVVAGE